jgi:signal peptidase II
VRTHRFDLAAVAAFLLLVGCDHASKRAAEANLAGRPPATVVPGVLDLRYAENPGIAFNLERFVPEPARAPALVIAAVVMLAVVGRTWVRRRGLGPGEILAWSMIAAGAVGNLVDRLAHGHVVDFIHVHRWPVFNVADVAIVAGAALLLMQSLRRQSAARRVRT